MPRLLLLSLLCLNSGCSIFMTQTSDVIPEDALTMKAVYQAHLGQGSLESNSTNQDKPASVSDPASFLAEPDSIQPLFPPVKNPLIQIYVEAHMSAADIPIPSYTTQIPLYRGTYYALPGEPTHD